MLDFFEIAGSHIKYADIKEFKLVQREYIFRPTYAETNNILKGVFGSKYEFSGMQPYAAIIDETSHKFSTSEYKAKNMNESVVKDLFEGTMTTIGDKFNIKALRSVKYHCINQAGRRFTTYLEDIPTKVVRKDGKVSDVRKNDELYHLLGEPIAPTIEMVDALYIKTAKEEYTLYGAGIIVEDAQQAYNNLMVGLDEYSSMKKEKKKLNFPKITVKEINIPKPTFHLPTKKESAKLPEKANEGEIIDVEVVEAVEASEVDE